jgi:tRNA (guanine10-N2)-methyltransferase
LDDVLYFAAEVLVDGGRLAMWMPTANDEDVELTIPQSPYLKLSSTCVQSFNRWSRMLLTYVRLPESVTGPVMKNKSKAYNGVNADELNKFRRRVSRSSPKPIHSDTYGVVFRRIQSRRAREKRQVLMQSTKRIVLVE